MYATAMAQAHFPAGLATCLAMVLAGPAAFASPNHIGAERCGACHQKAYQAWRKTPHAQALVRLTEAQQRDPKCRSCHTMDPWSDDAALAGVQCESCHGPGQAYAPELVMRDARLSQMLGLKQVTEQTCLPCHRSDSPRLRPFDFASLVMQVNHAAPAPAPAPKK